MSEFVVCSSIVSGALGAHKYYWDFLVYFVQNNPIRIVYDHPNKLVIKKYYEIALKDSTNTVGPWLNALLNSLDANGIDVICELENVEEPFLELASNITKVMCKDPAIVVWNKNTIGDYQDVNFRTLDRVEAYREVANIVRYGSKEGMMAGNIININGNNNNIVNESLVTDAFNATQGHGVSKDDLQVIVEAVAQSQNKEAGILMDRFAEELTKDAPQKTFLESMWDGIVKLAPELSKVSAAAASIIAAF